VEPLKKRSVKTQVIFRFGPNPAKGFSQHSPRKKTALDLSEHSHINFKGVFRRNRFGKLPFGGTDYLERRLELSVNEAKSAIARPWRQSFLGFNFTAGGRTVA
jgi:hypothetical protein